MNIPWKSTRFQLGAFAVVLFGILIIVDFICGVKSALNKSTAPVPTSTTGTARPEP